VALSTTEVEYIALSEEVKEATWIGVKHDDVDVHCDNQGVVQLSKNGVFHEHTKHINVKSHFIRDFVNAKKVRVVSISIADNPAVMLTKVLPGTMVEFSD
jgi:hypothetical protein